MIASLIGCFDRGPRANDFGLVFANLKLQNFSLHNMNGYLNKKAPQKRLIYVKQEQIKSSTFNLLKKH